MSARRRLQRFAALYVFAVGLGIDSCITPNHLCVLAGNEAVEKMQLNPQIIQLSKAETLEGSTIGEGCKSKHFAAFLALRAAASNVSTQDIMWLQANGKPAAKIYAAFLAYAKDKDNGTHYFEELLDNDTPVEYQSGCEVFNTSLSAIARSVIATGKYLDFDATITGDTPIYARELERATIFADQLGAESGRHLEYLIFAAALEHAKELQKKDLEKLITSASPAGRIYAAILQNASGKFQKNAGLTRLNTDAASVSYVSGCKASKYQVREIARQLLATGKFHNFKL